MTGPVTTVSDHLWLPVGLPQSVTSFHPRFQQMKTFPKVVSTLVTTKSHHFEVVTRMGRQEFLARVLGLKGPF